MNFRFIIKSLIITSLLVLFTRTVNGMYGYLAHIFLNWWVWLTLMFWIPARYVIKNWLKILFRVFSGIFFIVTILTVILDLLVDYNIILI